MNKLKQNWSGIFLLLFVAVVWCFYRLEFPALMTFREQLQMFLFNCDYFTERVVYPAGMARYVAEFIVQFFNNISLGALLIALLAAALQRLTKVICRNDYLAYVPVLLLLYFLGNENVNFTFAVAILFVLLAIWGYSVLKTNVQRWIYALIAIPVFYWISGPVVLMLPLYMVYAELLRKERVLPVVAIIYAVAIICLSAFVVKAPFYRLWYGINYTILVAEYLPLQAVVPCCFVLMPVIGKFLPAVGEKNQKMVHIISCSLILLAVAFILPRGVEMVRYEIFEYDYLMRANNWQGIIHKAEKKTPKAPLSVASLNLALAMTGQLNDRAGQFFQNGPQGAFPSFNKNFLFSLMTSEIYFNVGLINTAHRFAFEANETIPDNNKSARIVKRLIQTSIINADYKVAQKYINLLKQTLFYAKWAERQEKLLGDENAIDKDPLYGYMREVRLKNDFFYSEYELEKMMGQLCVQSPKNVIAQQYLLLFAAFSGNQQKYMSYQDFLGRLMRGEINTDSLGRALTEEKADSTQSVREPVDGATSASQRVN